MFLLGVFHIRGKGLEVKESTERSPILGKLYENMVNARYTSYIFISNCPGLTFFVGLQASRHRGSEIGTRGKMQQTEKDLEECNSQMALRNLGSAERRIEI